MLKKRGGKLVKKGYQMKAFLKFSNGTIKEINLESFQDYLYHKTNSGNTTKLRYTGNFFCKENIIYFAYEECQDTTFTTNFGKIHNKLKNIFSQLGLSVPRITLSDWEYSDCNAIFVKEENEGTIESRVSFLLADYFQKNDIGDISKAITILLDRARLS